MDNITVRTNKTNKLNKLNINLNKNKMSNLKENGTNVLKSKRFVVRLSLVGKNQVIEFTNKKGVSVTYNHDKVYEVMKEKLSTLPCWTKYKSYTATGNLPMSVRNIELV